MKERSNGFVSVTESQGLMEPDTCKDHEIHSGVSWVMPSGRNERYLVESGKLLSICLLCCKE